MGHLSVLLSASAETTAAGQRSHLFEGRRTRARYLFWLRPSVPSSWSRRGPCLRRGRPRQPSSLPEGEKEEAKWSASLRLAVCAPASLPWLRETATAIGEAGPQQEHTRLPPPRRFVLSSVQRESQDGRRPCQGSEPGCDRHPLPAPD